MGRTIALQSCSLLLVLCAVPQAARAAACCGDASGLGDRLNEAEVAAFTTRLSVRGRFGSYDASGNFSSLPPAAQDVSFQLDQDFDVRVASQLELGTTLGTLLTYRAGRAESEVGGGFSDLRARARLTLVSSTADRWLPGASLIAGAVIPTGVPARSSNSALLSDVTGQGDGEAVFGVTCDKVFEGLLLARIDASVGFFVPAFVDAVQVQRSPRLTVSFVAGPSFERAAIALGVSREAEAAPSSAPPGTAGRTRTELALVGVVDVGRSGSIVASVHAPLPADGSGQNETASMTASLGYRFGVLESRRI